jgi:hypothetical protein
MRMNGTRLSQRWPEHAGDQVQLCIETQGRDILATIVNDAVTEAMRGAAFGPIDDRQDHGPASGQPRIGGQ